ncbi:MULTISPECIES: gluconokinase [unclassified Sphingomonas]|uniref:gluconokinase n=2 Tax=unclassified Sphingomonas TaxID=196159 RepID=UPI000E74C930|nr:MULTISPECIES: gluconokinase [unclassified Sphingomonas]
MGVSGSGKSTLGAELARHLRCDFLEGDDFHSADSVAKMRSGHPLDDQDRWPWLDRIAAGLHDAALMDGTAVAACSALKRAYRDRLADAVGMPLLFVFLDTKDSGELARRLVHRADHYMPASLLASQLDTLEELGPDERAVTLDAEHAPDRLCAEALAWIGREMSGPAETAEDARRRS